MPTDYVTDHWQVNMNEKDYARKKNKFLPKIHAWYGPSFLAVITIILLLTLEKKSKTWRDLCQFSVQKRNQYLFMTEIILNSRKSSILQYVALLCLYKVGYIINHKKNLGYIIVLSVLLFPRMSSAKQWYVGITKIRCMGECAHS